MLSESKELFKDHRKKPDGTPLRQSWELPFLSGPLGELTSTDVANSLYEAQVSLAITGVNHKLWTAYCFVDTYFKSEDRVEDYHKIRGECGGQPDPLAAGCIDAEQPIWNPRQYFLIVLDVRVKEVRREWNMIVAKMEHAVSQYV